ncbi:hypothetical protein [uncultured Winogradskyella sp.]|uniref:hypothetical protein n=1 Tax=uncultured Winogradskyella sp. TaxID=395353 RepID=UPI0026385A04|nr:hypothetical protein [uncultured Winogradskyella sp.]
MTNTNRTYSPKGIIKTLTILHYAYCVATLIFGIIAIFITENGTMNFSDTEDIFFYLVPGFAIVLAFMSNLVFQQNLKRVQQKSTLKEKLVHYQSSRIIRYAMLEAPAFFAIVIFIITSNQLYLIIAIIMLTYLFLLRPTKLIIREDLDLNSKQELEFREALN